MKAFERALRRFGIESARRHVMRGEIVEQCAGDGGLADAALVRADQNQCWFSHDRTLTDATSRLHPEVISTQPLESWEASSPRLRSDAIRRICNSLRLTAVRYPTVRVTGVGVPVPQPGCDHGPDRAPASDTADVVAPSSELPRTRRRGSDCSICPFVARRRQRDRAGIVAAGEFDQRRDTSFDARMGVEQFAEAFARIVDAHFHHGRGRARQFAAALRSCAAPRSWRRDFW